MLRCYYDHADTTGVQRAEAIFFENWLYLYCTFANNSLTSGCLIKLSLRESNETEDYEIPHAVGYTCSMTNYNQFEAYSGITGTVVDIKTGPGAEGNFSLNVSARVIYSREEFVNATRCVLGE